MKCPNCGGEISGTSKTCEYCGSQISLDMQKEQEQINKNGCPKCGSTNITFTREKQGELKGKRGTAVVRSTVGLCKDCGYTWTSTGNLPTKKNNLWLWVVGWIFCFPIPLTILLLRKKDMKPALKYGIIAAVWLVILIIGIGGSKEKDGSDKTPVASEQISSSSEASTSDTTTPTETVDMSIKPNVNSENGSVFFTLATGLPEDTKLTLVVTNNTGYKSEDTITVLKNGIANSSEFDDNGAGLSGKYTVSVLDADGKELTSREFTFQGTSASSADNDLAALRKELKDKYDVSEPSTFVKGDHTGNWRICKVASSTNPSDYAVDYAKAYIVPAGDDSTNIHYIVNFTLNTTTQLRVAYGFVEAKTTEYVKGEEHDASKIGGGMEYTDRFFNLETGEEITTDANPAAGAVDSEKLIEAVKEITTGSLGSGEKFTDISFADGVLSLSIDMSGADASILSLAEIAESRIGSVTDSILELDDSYYNAWDAVYLDFGDIGNIKLTKSQVKTNGYGKYFEYQYDVFE